MPNALRLQDRFYLARKGQEFVLLPLEARYKILLSSSQKLQVGDGFLNCLTISLAKFWTQSLSQMDDFTWLGGAKSKETNKYFPFVLPQVTNLYTEETKLLFTFGLNRLIRPSSEVHTAYSTYSVCLAFSVCFPARPYTASPQELGFPKLLTRTNVSHKMPMAWS